MSEIVTEALDRGQGAERVTPAAPTRNRNNQKTDL